MSDYRSPKWHVVFLTTFVSLLAACGDDDSLTTALGEECGSSTKVEPATWSAVGALPDSVSGRETAWVMRDGWIALGPEDVGPTDPVVVVSMVILPPEFDDGSGRCQVELKEAELSTSAQAKGTSEQVDSKRYVYADHSRLSNPPRIDYIGPGSIKGTIQIPFTRVITSPTAPTTFGETIEVELHFTAHEP